MKSNTIQTSLGSIHVVSNQVPGTVPVLFLHGVYFDHHMWSYQMSRVTDRTVIAIDMPFHGKSKQIIRRDWDLDDCVELVVEVLDVLGIEKAAGIGHSWGSMTLLRSAVRHPHRFASLGLCNMPYKKLSALQSWQIRLQHTAMMFRGFYMRQAAKALMARSATEVNIRYLAGPMSQLSNAEIRHTDRAVRIDADDATSLIRRLTVPTLALIGKEDYVGVPPFLQTTIVSGGHVSPIEAPDEVVSFVERVLSVG
ncbi:MAG: alpha/beta hydrolase [Candidatus Kapabacteria bacterium]|nr:alpha/beta hydrolase [Candidatus Kapabacteria bacterium]